MTTKPKLLVDLSELAEAVAVGADDLGLVLPRGVRPQRRARLSDEPGAVALRARVLAREEYGEGRADEGDGHRAGDEVRVALRRDVAHRRDRDKPAAAARRRRRPLPRPYRRRRKRRRSTAWWPAGGRATSSCGSRVDDGSHCC